MVRSGIVESYNSKCMFNFLRKYHTVLPSGFPSVMFENSSVRKERTRLSVAGK